MTFPDDFRLGMGVLIERDDGSERMEWNVKVHFLRIFVDTITYITSVPP